MRTLTVRKVGETEKAVQYCVTFWIVEHPGHPVCGDGKEFFFNRWLPKRVVTPIDDTHIGIPKKFLEETLKILADKHPFQEVRYNAQFYPERFKWSVETISEKILKIFEEFPDKLFADSIETTTFVTSKSIISQIFKNN